MNNQISTKADEPKPTPEERRSARVAELLRELQAEIYGEWSSKLTGAAADVHDAEKAKTLDEMRESLKSAHEMCEEVTSEIEALIEQLDDGVSALDD